MYESERGRVLYSGKLKGVISDKGLEKSRLVRQSKAVSLTGAPLKTLNVTKFAAQVKNSLHNLVAGYVFELRQAGKRVAGEQDGWAIAPIDGEIAWNTHRRMHVASLSKFITAMAMTTLLNAKKIQYDTPIIKYLPDYWTKGANVAEITFRHLMTHTSGFCFCPDKYDAGFLFMKENVATGVSKVGDFKYENINFGLCRLLLPVIAGKVAAAYRPAAIEEANDTLWDVATFSLYNDYAQTTIFRPNGIKQASLYHEAGHALAYNYPASGRGWNSGDLALTSGSEGWHLSVADMLTVMDAFRRGGNIMSPVDAQQMLYDAFGIDDALQTDAGDLYAKIGLWENDDRQVEQSLAYFLPQEMEFVAFANSPIGATAKTDTGAFFNLVTKAYRDNLS